MHSRSTPLTHNRLNALRELLLCLTVAVGVSGCVTETTGGLPGPAPKTDRVQAQLDLARGYMEQREWRRARKPIDVALSIAPRNVEAHVLSAVLFQAQNEYALAEHHYRTALSIEPGNAQALNNYGSFLYGQGRYQDALVPLSTLVKDTSYRARSQAFENLGLAQLQTGERDAARSAFERAVDLNYRQARSNLELAELAYDDGRYPDAVERFKFYNNLAKPTARSLCLGLKLGAALNDANMVASYQLALKNLFPKQAAQCQATT